MLIFQSREDASLHVVSPTLRIFNDTFRAVWPNEVNELTNFFDLAEHQPKSQQGLETFIIHNERAQCKRYGWNRVHGVMVVVRYAAVRAHRAGTRAMEFRPRRERG
jgi:hypothetical protein